MASVSDSMNKNQAKGQSYSSYGREASEHGEETVNTLKDMAGKAGSDLRSFVDAGRDELAHAADHYRYAVQRSPMQAGLIALGAGFLLGMMVRR